jgi:hypothetical protein
MTLLPLDIPAGFLRIVALSDGVSLVWSDTSLYVFKSTLANSLTTRRDAAIFEGTWTSLMMVFTVGRRLGCSALSEPTPSTYGSMRDGK